MLQTFASPPRPVVRLDYPLLSWQRSGVVALYLLGLLVILGSGYWLGRSDGNPQAGPATGSALTPTPQLLRPRQQGTENDLAKLLTTYAPAPPGAAVDHNPRIVDFQIRLPGPEPTRLAYVLTAQSNGTPYAGRLRFEIAGWRDGRIEVLQAPGPEISPVAPARLQLSFSRYVRTEGVLLLPEGFTPIMVGVTLPPAGTASQRRLACIC